MKRFLITLLSILYLASSTGMTVHIHYCMGNIMGISLIEKKETRCGKCGMQKTLENGCCKDDHQTFKTNDHQLAKASFDFTRQQITSIPQHTYSLNSVPVFTTYVNKVVGVHAPSSFWRRCPIYIQVNDLRI
jgi:hypothetical protein